MCNCCGYKTFRYQYKGEKERMNTWGRIWNEWFHQPQHERIRAWDKQVKKLGNPIATIAVGYFFEFFNIVGGIGMYGCINPQNILSIAIFSNVMGIVFCLGMMIELLPVLQPGDKRVYEFCEYFPMEQRAVFQVRIGYLLKKIRNRGILLAIIYGILCLSRRKLDIALGGVLLYSLLFSAFQMVREIRYKK